MKELHDVINLFAIRDSCTCGKCLTNAGDTSDKTVQDKKHISVHFFNVALCQDTDKEEAATLLKAALKKHYPELGRLKGGPSYIEIGGAIGDQGLALKLIGLGHLLGLWQVITPTTMGLEGSAADEMAGKGFVMCSGIDLLEVDDDTEKTKT